MTHELPPRVALARRTPDAAEDDGGIDPGLAAALVEAIVDYPSFATACAACGVTSRSVKSMLQRGIQAGAPRSLRRFTLEFAQADAMAARDTKHQALLELRSGRTASAKLLFDLMAKRWPMETDNDVMAILSGGKRADSLRSRLERPSAMLVAMFKTVLAEPNEVWSSLLHACGWVRQLAAPAPDETEELPDEEELDEEEDPESPDEEPDE
jgi:hypothetical protein